MNKSNRITIISIMFLLFCTIVIASTAMGPTCKIKGKITNVSVREAYYQEDNGLSCNYKGKNVPETYFILINITNVSSVSEWGMQKCSEWYALNSIITIKFKDNSSKKNQIIEGIIQEVGDECSAGTMFIDYQILEESLNDNVTLVEEQKMQAEITSEKPKNFILSIWSWIKSLFR